VLLPESNDKIATNQQKASIAVISAILFENFWQLL